MTRNQAVAEAKGIFPLSAARNAKQAEVAAWTGLTNWYRTNRQGTANYTYSWK